MTMNVCQTSVNSIMADSQLFMVDAQEMQHGGMNVVNHRRIVAISRLIAKIIAGAMADSAFHATTCKPCGETIRIVISAPATLA